MPDRLLSASLLSPGLAARTGLARAAALALLLPALAASAASASAPSAPGPTTQPSRSITVAENQPAGNFTLVQLKRLVADRIGPWKRTAVDVPLESRALPPPPTVISTYRQGKMEAKLTIADAGAISAAGDAAQWKGPPSKRQTESGDEFVYREGRHTVREIERREPSAREVMLILTNGIVITVRGEGVDMAALKALADGIPIESAEALVRPAKK